MAICFALGCIPDGTGEVQRTMMPELGDKMLFEHCHPDFGGKGYVYELDKSGFNYAYGSQFVCYEEIEPERIIEINVDEHLDLCIFG
jgi:hypothetical protein